MDTTVDTIHRGSIRVRVRIRVRIRVGDPGSSFSCQEMKLTADILEATLAGPAL